MVFTEQTLSLATILSPVELDELTVFRECKLEDGDDNGGAARFIADCELWRRNRKLGLLASNKDLPESREAPPKIVFVEFDSRRMI